SFFFFQAEDGIRDFHVTGVQTCALPICNHALWLALGGAAPAYGDAAAFAAGQAAFGLLPADLRLLLAPRWIDRLLAEDRPAEAQIGRAACRERVSVSWARRTGGRSEEPA